MSKTELQLLSSAMFNDTSETIGPQIQTVFRNALGLCQVAHLSTIKAYDKKVLDLALRQPAPHESSFQTLDPDPTPRPKLLGRARPLCLCRHHNRLRTRHSERQLLERAGGSSLLGPLCKEYSRLKLLPNGPSALRTSKYMDGLPQLKPWQQQKVDDRQPHAPTKPRRYCLGRRLPPRLSCAKSWAFASNNPSIRHLAASLASRTAHPTHELPTSNSHPRAGH